jgi:riboflavin kinase/FMN adenylyltransferase
MKVYHDIKAFSAPGSGVALTIGNFDGVHRGHVALVQAAAAEARRRQAPAVVVTFEPHPAAILAPHRAPPRLNTPDEKLALLGMSGADIVIVLRSEPALFAESAVGFLDRYIAPLRPFHIVEGESFHFGKGRAGSVDTLREHAPRLGYELTILEAVNCPELPGNPTVSSSVIREALQIGRVSDASIMLGRPHRIAGTVGHGESRGAALGFPTANIEDIAQLIPGFAVYAAIAEREEGERHPAVVNVGPQPTFNQDEPRVEAHLLDFKGDLRGRRLALYFVEALREQRRFAGPKELVEQIERDVSEGRRILSRAIRLPDFASTFR